MTNTGDKEAFTFDIETPKGVKTIAIQTPQVPQVNALKTELEEFVNAILQNTPTVVSERDGYRAMEVAHQIIQKITSNITVE
jgi:predicted dehydrogenase